MPRIEPEYLRPFSFHGLELHYRDNDTQALADCPFCGRENKFSINIESGQYRCFVCSEGTDKGGGNALVFLRKLHEIAQGLTNVVSTSSFALDRGVTEETFGAWGVCQSPITDDWMVPGYNVGGNLTTLYVRRRGTLYPTPTLGSAMFGGNLYDSSKPIVDVAEGPWDGMALWESLRSSKRLSNGDLALTGSESSSLLADRSVVAIPGLGSIGKPMQKWLGFFRGKTVNLWFDSDHPKRTCTQGHSSYSTLENDSCPVVVDVKHYMGTNETDEQQCRCKAGRDIIPAGYAGVQRAGDIIGETAFAVNYCQWGDNGYADDLPSGHDLRDELCSLNTIQN